MVARVTQKYSLLFFQRRCNNLNIFMLRTDNIFFNFIRTRLLRYRILVYSFRNPPEKYWLYLFNTQLHVFWPLSLITLHFNNYAWNLFIYFFFETAGGNTVVLPTFYIFVVCFVAKLQTHQFILICFTECFLFVFSDRYEIVININDWSNS